MIFQRVLLAATLALATSSTSVDASSTTTNRAERKRFLRRSSSDNNSNDANRKLMKAKSAGGSNGDKNKEGVTAVTNTIRSPTAAPVKTSTTVADWIEGCPSQASIVEDCTFGSTGSSPATSAQNCMTCLKGFAGFNGSTGSGAANSCSKSATCGTNCPKELLDPFFACGKGVDAAFYGTSTGTNTDADPNTVVVITTPNNTNNDPSPTTPEEPEPATPEDLWDTINCPALWPGSGTECVMQEDYDYKYCNYYEFGDDALCTCRADELLWVCANGPPPTTSALVVDKEDLTVVVEVVDTTGSNTTPQLLPPGVDLELSSGTTAQENPLCPAVAANTGDACSPGPFYETACCYTDPSPVEGTLGTIECKCGGGDGVTTASGDPAFRCLAGALSACTV